MTRNLAQPLDTRILQLLSRIEPSGDGVANEGCTLLAQERVELLGPGDEGVNFGGLAVEVSGDGALLGEGREGDYGSVCYKSSLLNSKFR